MGHKKICFCGSLFFLSSEQERYAGLAAAMRHAELPCDDRNLMVTPDYDELARRTRAGELTALFCCSDRQAEKMVGEMMKRGIRIPEDLSIHGFDDNVCSPDNPVPLSTIHQSFEQIGQRAAKLLLSTLEHGQQELQPVSVLADVHPVVRASVRQLD